MKLRAYAKINLMLDILGKTDDGYHSLFMIMQSIGLYDTISISKAKDITLTCSNPALPSDSKNIAFKAAEEFFSATKISGGAEIHIEKNIPLAAGLAGGSADAAAVLIGLNEIYNAGLCVEELCNIGLKLGADVPFCIKGGTMAALDIGQVLAPLPPIKDNYYVLVKPPVDISTAAAYAAFDKAENIHHADINGILRALSTDNEDKAYPLMKNVFEQFIEVPNRAEIKHIMRTYGSLAHLMTGSGPTIYAIFDNEDSASKCAEELKLSYSDVFICKPKKCGVEKIT
ncbi:MAG: 4-(cytidine 5'-diphospho)-2-C-methyl-D-erythritol kinase [Ruminococcaceae bacterium]|nr:4-(cytidine 5'-diphospho)-2-C-methyl-D-erythritol kinase [Oscillospiraceae bacterium]